MSTPAIPSYRKRVGYHATFLGIIALLSSAALVIGNLRTQDEIALRHLEDMQASLSQVIPATLHDNAPLHEVARLPAPFGMRASEVEVYRAARNGEIAAVAFRITAPNGYSGPIQLIMGVDRDGRVLGVRVLSHAETPGLGDKIEVARSPWIRGFDGLSLADTPREEWRVKKDGGRFDQFTGATITPRAVVGAVHEGLQFFQRHRDALLAPLPKAGVESAK
ncbi:MAG: electron transport complex subunit RsxG [Chromatiales bacterium]|nr:electron transport complex subunit RsxG [Chromatiales bacterium]MDX9765936.1 electron transport complex subunit RsxG [Ectothiorhodospiraceae bacterium]